MNKLLNSPVLLILCPLIISNGFEAPEDFVFKYPRPFRVQRNKLLPQDLSSVINGDLGPIPLPTNQLATEFLSLSVSDTTYLINSCYGFFLFDFLRFDFLRLCWNKFMFLFFGHISPPSPLDKNTLCSNSFLRPAVSRAFPCRYQGVRQLARHKDKVHQAIKFGEQTVRTSYRRKPSPVMFKARHYWSGLDSRSSPE